MNALPAGWSVSQLRPEPRRRVYVLDKALMFELFDGVAVRIAEGVLPAGARLVATAFDFPSQCFEMIVEHPAFDVVPRGELPPRFPLRTQGVASIRSPSIGANVYMRADGVLVSIDGTPLGCDCDESPKLSRIEVVPDAPPQTWRDRPPLL